MVGPAAKREVVAHLQAELGLSERRACSIVSADSILFTAAKLGAVYASGRMIRYRSCRRRIAMLNVFSCRGPRSLSRALRLA
jgi:putative transposase